MAFGGDKIQCSGCSKGKATHGRSVGGLGRRRKVRVTHSHAIGRMFGAQLPKFTTEISAIPDFGCKSRRSEARSGDGLEAVEHRTGAPTPSCAESGESRAPRPSPIYRHCARVEQPLAVAVVDSASQCQHFALNVPRRATKTSAPSTASHKLQMASMARRWAEPPAAVVATRKRSWPVQLPNKVQLPVQRERQMAIGCPDPPRE